MKMNNKNIIKFWFRFTINLISENRIKFSFLMLGTILLTIALNLKDSIVFRHVEAHYEDGNKHYYEVSGKYNALEYNSEQKLFTDTTNNVSGNMLKVIELNDGTITLYIFVGILYTITFITLIVNDRDINLDIKSVMSTTIEDDLRVVTIEDNKYLYISYSKILEERTSKKYNNDLYLLRISEFFKLNTYYSKQEQRNIKFDKLGI